MIFNIQIPYTTKLCGLYSCH